MSKYKLVPVEPTDEMGIAGCEAVTEMPNNTWLDHYEAVTCFKAMLAAAPAVQGEPVAYLRQDQLAHVKRMGAMLGEIANTPRADKVPVYAAPLKVSSMTDQSTNFIASNGEHRNPFYQGTFEDETTEQMERRLHWATAAVEAERVVQNSKTAPQPTPDVSALVAIAQEIANLHAKRKVVLTVHVEALEDALANLHQSPTKCPGTGCTDQGCPAHYAND